MTSAERDRMREVAQAIATDAEQDVNRFEGQPFTGRTVAEYFGCQAAAIAALAKIVDRILEQGGAS